MLMLMFSYSRGFHSVRYIIPGAYLVPDISSVDLRVWYWQGNLSHVEVGDSLYKIVIAKRDSLCAKRSPKETAKCVDEEGKVLL